MTLRLDRKYNRRFGSKGREFAIGIPTFHFKNDDKPSLMRWALVGAVVFHLLLFAIEVPSWDRPLRADAPVQKAFVLQQVRFKPPAVEKQAPTRLNKKARKVPIPDPTPDDPEPILRETDVEEPILAEDLSDLDFVVEAPPAPPVPGLGTRAIAGDVLRPEKIYAPQPPYTEEARQARITGVVLLQAIVDIFGNVTNVKIRKNLPAGLGDSAVDTVLTWKFRPATLDGDPVPVYFNFTINFSLQ